MAKIRLNFKPFFEREGKTIIRSYQKLMKQGEGVRLDKAPTKKRPNGKPWMIDTGELRSKGFMFTATRNNLVVQPSEGFHSSSSKPSYRDLFLWHNRGRSSYNGQKYSGVFGKLPLGSQFPQRFKKEFMRQAKKQLYRELTSR